jgi:hypothetical protein
MSLRRPCVPRHLWELGLREPEVLRSRYFVKTRWLLLWPCVQGTLLPLVNWNTPHNQTSFWKRQNYTRVTISLEGLVPPPTYTTATLASCGTLAPSTCALKQGGIVRLNITSKLQFSVDVAIADAIILR